MEQNDKLIPTGRDDIANCCFAFSVPYFSKQLFGFIIIEDKLTIYKGSSSQTKYGLVWKQYLKKLNESLAT